LIINFDPIDKKTYGKRVYRVNSEIKRKVINLIVTGQDSIIK